MTKNKTLIVKLTPELKEQLRKLALAQGMKMATYIRQLILKQIK